MIFKILIGCGIWLLLVTLVLRTLHLAKIADDRIEAMAGEETVEEGELR